MINIKPFSACILLAFMSSSCSKEPQQKAETPSFAIKTTVLCERNPDYPFTDYHTIQKKILPTSPATPISIDIEDYIGHSYTTEFYPVEDARNIGRTVIDVDKYINDFEGRYEKISLNQSYAQSYSYTDFNRLSEKTDISSKVSITSNSNIFKVFSHSSESTFEDVFSDSYTYTDRTVYGESNILFLFDKYDLSLPSNLYGRIIDGYLSPSFTEYLYNSTPDELFNQFGCFVLTKLIAGGRATALYKATTYETASVTERESAMNNLISASVGIGNTSIGVGFGNNNSGSSSDSIVHNFSEALFSVHTYGGIASYNQFTPPKDVNDSYFNLNDWCLSLNNEQTHTIANIPDYALIPLYEFIEEDNLKNKFINIMENGHSSNSNLLEPYILIDISPKMNMNKEIFMSVYALLYTRYGDYLQIFSTEDVIAPTEFELDTFIAQQKARLQKQFPGITILITDYEEWDYFKDLNREITINNRFVIDTTAGFNLFYMNKYQNPTTGKIYLIPKNNSPATIYTVFGDYAMNDYSIKNIVESMPTLTNDTFESKRMSSSHIIAL